MRIWYRSFIDPEVHAPYFERLRAHLAAIAGPDVEYEVAGIRPPDQALHRITEFRRAARAIDNAVRAGHDGCDSVPIGHFQDSGLWEARSAAAVPVVGMGEASMLGLLSAGEHDFRVGEAVVLNPIAVACRLAEAAAGLRRASGWEPAA